MKNIQLYIKKRGTDEYMVNPRILSTPIEHVPPERRECVRKAQEHAAQQAAMNVIMRIKDGTGGKPCHCPRQKTQTLAKNPDMQAIADHIERSRNELRQLRRELRKAG